MKFHFVDDDGNPTGNLCSFVAAGAALASAGAASAGATVATGLSVSALGTGAVLGSAGISGLGVGAAAASAFSFSNILSFASGISSLAGGFLQGQQLEAQSELEGLRAQNELINGQRDVVAQKEQLISDLASFNARRAGAGVSTATGSPAAAKRAAIEDQEFQTDITRGGARIRAATRRTTASSLSSQAGGARLSGIASAAALGAKVIDRETRRG